MRQATQRLEGVEVLGSDDSNGRPELAETKPGKTKAARKGAGTDEVGRALRSAYDETLQEDVPDDFLSLLGKLS